MSKEAVKHHDGIAEIKHFIDTKGRQVRMFSPIDSSPKLLVGIVEIQIPDGRRVGLEFRYPLGTGLVDAFTMYDKAAEAAKQEFIKKQSSVVLGPDGKPIRQRMKAMDVVS